MRDAHIKHREYDSFEECARFIKGSPQTLIILRIQFFVQCDIFSDGI